MHNTRNLCAPFLLSVLMAGACFAQAQKAPKDEQKFYHLDFVVKEIGDSKVVNARSYSTMISTGGNPLPGEIRTGNKVPYQTGPGSSTPHYEYLDVGVNFDCQSAREVEGELALHVAAEISNLAPGQTPTSGSLPLLRQNRWRSDVILPLRKPTVIFSSDDPTSTHKMQVELTATPIK
jgi:hypothetical protein